MGPWPRSDELDHRSRQILLALGAHNVRRVHRSCFTLKNIVCCLRRNDREHLRVLVLRDENQVEPVVLSEAEIGNQHLNVFGEPRPRDKKRVRLDDDVSDRLQRGGEVVIVAARSHNQGKSRYLSHGRNSEDLLAGLKYACCTWMPYSAVPYL